MKRRILALLLCFALLLALPAPPAAAEEDAAPVIALTYIPVWGEDAYLEGVVFRPDGGSFEPAAYRVALYLQITEGNAYWVKPYNNQTWESVQSDGSFSIRYKTGGYDSQAIRMHVMLIPASYTPAPTVYAESASFRGTLAQALDYVVVERSEDGYVSADPDRSPPAGWQDPGKPSGLSPKEDRLAVDIGFYTDGSWAGGPLSEASIRAQLTRAAAFADTVRFYSAAGPVAPAYEIARELGLTVAGTAWISGDEAADQAELDGLIAQCNAGRVRLACVGSETLLRGEQSIPELIEKLNYVRDRLEDPSIPVTTADTLEFFLNSPALRRACDVLFVNLFPYWSGSSIESAPADFAEAVARLRAKAGGKEILISETGWPTAGQTIQGSAVPGEENAARYFEAIRAWSLETGTPLFWFSFSDEPYKANTEGACGAHWGLLEDDLDLKPCYEMTEFFLRRRFTDVSPNAYYASAVYWAIRNRITGGTGPSSFSPKKPCTREQVVTFLWAAAGRPAPADTPLPFTDVGEGAYYAKAVRWALEAGVTSGVSETLFGTGQPCTRAQVATFLYSAVGRPPVAEEPLPFADVKPTAYYYKAVCWAYQNKVTAGATATEFAPRQICTRAQVMTFLYKLFGAA